MSSAKAPRVWLVTGCSSGLGKALVLHILKNEDKVIATSRKIDQLDDLRKAGAVTMQLDPNVDLPVLHKFAEQSIAVFGRVDILVNNAAYVAYGTVEETTPDETFQQYQTNLFAVMNMCRAFLPHFRSRRAGTIASVGSIGARLISPNLALYHGTKAALRSTHLALDLEVRPLGITTCLIEPGGFRTNLIKPEANVRTAGGTLIPEYESVRETSAKWSANFNGRQIGNPDIGAQVMYDVLTSTGVAAGKEVPAEFLLGSDAYRATKGILSNDMQKADDWKDISCSTDFPDGLGVTF